MKAGIYIRKEELKHDPRYAELIGSLSEAGCECYQVGSKDELQPQTDLILAVGGDGTFLSASIVAADTGIPVMGANLGRLGFLSENRWQAVGAALASGDYTVENRTILHSCISACTGVGAVDNWPYALNEVCVHRTGASMLAVDVTIDGTTLPTYWADGLLVATSSGSTAYSLSVGGPIVFPGAKALIITPIASHNLNIRPLIVPDTSVVSFRVRARDGKAIFTADNRSVEIPDGTSVTMTVAQFSLKRVRLNSSNFINALTEKLLWGEDIRNNR
jgi:NAD+ kinase